MKSMLLAAVAVVSLMSVAHAADAYKFALIPKGMDNPYFDLSRDGCQAEAKKLGNVTCIYKGPATHEPATEVQITQDFITQGIDGIAISVADADSVMKVIKQARDANIPVITFDADADKSARQAYVGTDNTEMGRELGRQLIKAHPKAGTFATQSGGPAAANLNDRLKGLYEVLKGAGWTEVKGSPAFCNDDSALAAQQLSDFATANPDIDAIIPIGGWALFAPKAYKSFVDSNMDKMKAGKLPLVMPDTLPVELQLLKDGYVSVLVGQRPYEMGEKAMDMLVALKKGEKVPVMNAVGLDVVTKDNVDKFLSAAK
ncbi:sugar-binding protein [Lichenihabitans psoromatis]|uniref:sugar-binding protein n=1 Tax=Lichenihabitans psoromatis TaxID=2528642 RepID=UPI0010366242|nr:sugar-binding protein [Lichenihabitans psoromatis]